MNDERQRQLNSEKMYCLQKGVASYVQELLLEATSPANKTFSREQMQRLLQSIRKGIQTGESEEIISYREKIQHKSEGDIQEIGEISSWVENQDKSKRVFGVVSAPTEKMLLLWDTRRNVESGKGQVQQQIRKIDDRQNGLIKTIRKRKLGTLLLSVQPYKERLFYSLGNGQDWSNIYQSEMAKCKTLSSILEKKVPKKYFLSKETMTRLINYEDNQLQTLLRQDTKHSEMGATLLKVNSMHKKKYQTPSEVIRGGLYKGKIEKFLKLKDAKAEPFDGIRLQFPDSETARGRVVKQKSQTLQASGAGGVLLPSMKIRKLTPIECERLMSWQDDWTRWGIDDTGNKVEISDSQRYKMCGNGVVSNVVKEIIKNLIL